MNLQRLLLGLAAMCQFLSQLDVETGVPRWLKLVTSCLAMGLAVAVNREAVPIAGPMMARARESKSLSTVEEPTKPGVPPVGGFIAWLLGLGALVGLAGCPHPIPTGPGPIAHVVACGEQAIKGRGIGVIPAINTCLTGGNSTTCLLALLDPALGITEDVIACLVRGRGSEYNAASMANPSDTLSATAAKNATRFILDRQITFTQ